MWCVSRFRRDDMGKAERHARARKSYAPDLRLRHFRRLPTVGQKDKSGFANPEVGDLRSSSYDELQQLLVEYDRDRFLGHINKVELVKGDIGVSAPAFLESHPHLVVSLLFIDCDLYDPTK